MLVLTACQAPTQIELVLSTDAACADLTEVSITVGALDTLEQSAPVSVTSKCHDGNIGSLVVVPSGASDEQAALKIVAAVGGELSQCKPPDYAAHCIVARRALHYVANRTLTVPVVLRVNCTGIVCGTTETCAGGNCKPAAVDSSHCLDEDGCSDLELFGCPSKAGPTMLRSGNYCIDSHEVSNQQYGDFLAAGAIDPASQASYCAFNESFTPSIDWNKALAEQPQHPVRWIDWCDASAYCRWAGKRLCRGLDGKPGDTKDWARINEVLEWHAACSAHDSQQYPYGDDYEPNACNGADYGVADTVAVGSAPTCQGALPGLYDMSGNVSEWVDACSNSNNANDQCFIGGGSFRSHCDTEFEGANALRCQLPCAAARQARFIDVGVRCCGP